MKKHNGKSSVRSRRFLFQVTSIAILAALSACSSVPLAKESDDRAAKEFQASPDQATFYVFRDQVLMGAAVTTPLFLDGKLVGGINTFTFRKINVPAGEHELSASSNTGAFATLRVQAERSHVYFVRLTGWPKLSLVSGEEGRKQIKKCSLTQ
jgi:hypothetical protein